MMSGKKLDVVFILFLQVVLVVLFALFAVYDEHYDKEAYPSKWTGLS